MSIAFPFSAIVGQEELKLALLACAIDATIGGVLVLGDRGTGKSTAVRALAGLLPPMRVVSDCRYGCDPDQPADWCSDCRARPAKARPASETVPVPVVDLPLGATEDRVLGALNLEQALSAGVRAFEPGLLAQANRGFLYVDEVNLLEDHLVDLLIDVAASGVNVVEREGLSVRHPARFVLVGSGNPEEGDLRPQLLDRFGLSVEIRTPQDVEQRIEIVRRRDQYERSAAAFSQEWQPHELELRRKITAARKRLPKVEVGDQALRWATRLCMRVGTDGLRGELTLIRAARALAAFHGRHEVGIAELIEVAPPALRHRLRRDPMDEAGSGLRIERAISEQGSELG
jgi:magnesium chelatase subunit I